MRAKDEFLASLMCGLVLQTSAATGEMRSPQQAPQPQQAPAGLGSLQPLWGALAREWASLVGHCQARFQRLCSTCAVVPGVSRERSGSALVEAVPKRGKQPEASFQRGGARLWVCPRRCGREQEYCRPGATGFPALQQAPALALPMAPKKKSTKAKAAKAPPVSSPRRPRPHGKS